MPFLFLSSPAAATLRKNASVTKACHIQTLTAYTYISLPLMFRHLSRRVVAPVVPSRTQKYFIIRFLFNDLNRTLNMMASVAVQLSAKMTDGARHMSAAIIRKE